MINYQSLMISKDNKTSDPSGSPVTTVTGRMDWVDSNWLKPKLKFWLMQILSLFSFKSKSKKGIEDGIEVRKKKKMKKEDGQTSKIFVRSSVCTKLPCPERNKQKISFTIFTKFGRLLTFIYKTIMIITIYFYYDFDPVNGYDTKNWKLPLHHFV